MQEQENEWKPKAGLDVLLLLLYAPQNGEKNAQISGITRLDKLMFILSKTEEFEYLFEGDYIFIPYNFGPFATELLDDLEALIAEDVIERVKSDEQYDSSSTRDAEVIDEETGELPDKEISWNMYSYDLYNLTSKGMLIASKLWDCTTDNQRERISSVKRIFNSMSLTSLLRYVYKNFPDYAGHSLIKGKILIK
jgi:hypothetical protein